MAEVSFSNARNSLYLAGRLLFVEICLLAGIAGILAWRFPAPGLLLFCFILLLGLPGAQGFARPRSHALALSLFFILGLAYTAWREPSPPPAPSWLEQAAPAAVQPPKPALSADADRSGARSPASLPILARVDSLSPLPGGRLRVVLRDLAVDPAFTGSSLDAHSLYRGKVVWTRHNYDAQEHGLLPGQNVEANLRLVPVRGFANPQTWNAQTYWNDKGVYFRAVNRMREAPFSYFGDFWWSGEETTPLQRRLRAFQAWPAEKRRTLQRNFLAALPEDGAGKAILPALIFGDRSLLTPAQMDIFARSTLAHSLALSGLHLGFAVLAGYAAARGAGRLLPGIWLRVSRPQLALLLSLPVAALYLWLGQAPLSLLRAACMLFFWTLLVFLRRPRVLLDGLFAALAFILLVNPLALFELGLQLSALSVAAIALCMPGVTKLADKIFPPLADPAVPGCFARLRRKALRGAVLIAGVSLCIQVALLPIAVNAFGVSGLLFPLNMLWLPVLGAVVLPLAFSGLLAVTLGFQGLAGLLLYLAGLPCEALLALLRWIDAAGLLAAPLMPRPHWLCAAGFWLLCLSGPGLARSCLRAVRQKAWMRGGQASLKAGRAWEPRRDTWRKHNAEQELPEENTRLHKSLFPFSRGVSCPVAAFVALVLLASPVAVEHIRDMRAGVRLSLLDVGQGQSVLVEWSGLGGEDAKGRVLIDGGGFASGTFDVGKAVVAPVLTYMALPRLNAVINSHPDTDHLAGLLFILDTFHVRRYYGNGDMVSTPLRAREREILQRHGIRQQTLAAGNSVRLAPDLFLEALWPAQASEGGVKAGPDRRNTASLVLRLVWRGKGLALICGDAEKSSLRALARLPSAELESQVLVLAHHGSAASLAPSFYRAVNPDLALAACGFANRWGFPSRAVSRALKKQGVPLRSTAEAGQISIRWTAPGRMEPVALHLGEKSAR